jgi:aldehyde dehydrogenase (NAD+)
VTESRIYIMPYFGVIVSFHPHCVAIFLFLMKLQGCLQQTILLKEINKTTHMIANRLRQSTTHFVRNYAKKVDIKYTQLFINNEFVNSVSGNTFETINPATEEVITSLQEAQKEDVDIAVKVARRAFEPWRNTSTKVRAQLLYKWADAIEANQEYIADLECLDNGKPRQQVLDVDIALTVDTLRHYAGYCDKPNGKTIPSHDDFFIYTTSEPYGVCGQIIPWNFPLLMFAWKVAPALATGNTIVLKTAEQTPLSALYVASLARDVGFPAGVLNILSGFGETAGDAIARHPDIDKVAFTGSTEVGKKIQIASGQTNLKAVTLELGGKSPLIFLDDMKTDKDIEAAVAAATDGIYFNQGQVCTASSRIFVPERSYRDFLACSKERSEKRVVGDPFHKDTAQGPQVSKEQFDRILGYIKAGKEEAELITGGDRVGSKGFYIQPTVFAAHDNAKIVTEEIFGPVLSVLKYNDVNEAIRRANNSEYGLAAGVFTNNITNALKVAHNLKAGTVWVNCYNVFHMNTPFGGFKQSGFGRELGEGGIAAYSQNKSVVIKVPGLKEPVNPIFND